MSKTTEALCIDCMESEPHYEVNCEEKIHIEPLTLTKAIQLSRG